METAGQTPARPQAGASIDAADGSVGHLPQAADLAASSGPSDLSVSAAGCTALTIAIFKATIVVLFFMHVRYNTPLMWVVAGAGFFFLLILLSLTLQDYVSRGWEGPPPMDFISG